MMIEEPDRTICSGTRLLDRYSISCHVKGGVVTRLSLKLRVNVKSSLYAIERAALTLSPELQLVSIMELVVLVQKAAR